MKRRILLADDELTILLTLKAILEMNGFEVETAASAREAKEKLRHSTFDMVITDMWMESETAGLEVIRAARRRPYNPATAVLTAYPNLGMAARKNEAADTVLVKPTNTGDLLRQIEALLVTHADHKAGVVPEEDVPEPLDSAERSAEDEAFQSIGRQSMLVLIDSLSEEQQQVLTLKFVFNFGNAEVATILGKTDGAVKSLQHRALVSLQKQLEQT